jgi:hypothetical protein
MKTPKKKAKKITKETPLNTSKKASFSRPQIFLFIVTVSVLSLITFRQALDFGFWRDDWTFLWASLYEPNMLLPWNLHPGTKYEDLLLIHLFGLNSTYWQLFGIVLRILAALAIALMMLGLTKSKKIALLAGIFFAVSFVALETVSWRSVHIVPMIMIFIGMGFYYFSRFMTTENLREYLMSFLFFILATIADPARSLPIVPLIFFLQLGSWWISPQRSLTNLYRKGIVSVILGVGIFIVMQLSPSNHTFKDFISLVTPIVEQPNILKKFFGSMGNLFLGWVVQIPEQGSLSYYVRNYAFYSLYFLLGATAVSFYFLFRKKSYTGLLFLFFILWVVIFYVPNWLFDKNLVVAGTHRYIGMSGMGMIGLVALAVGSIST